MKKILFFTPYGGRTGSEMLLWNIINNMDSSKFQAAVYSEKAGVLKDTLPPHIPFYTNPFNTTGAKKIALKMLNGFNYPVYEKYILAIHQEFKPDYWYLNTNATAHIAKIAKKAGVKVIAHICEMPYILYETVTKDDMAEMMEADLVIGLSEVGCRAVEILGAKTVKKLYPSIDFGAIKPNLENTKAIRKQLNIPDDAFVWVMSGSFNYRKGVDYLPQLIRLMREKKKKCFFVWLGGGSHVALEYYVKKELEYYGLDADIVIMKSLSDDYYDYMALADAFLLLSHEETFGMVNLEAAYLGKPILTFDCGGVSDIMLDGMGKIVKSWNVTDFADAMVDMMEGKIPFDATIARNRALEFDAKTLYIEWESIMDGMD